MEKKRAVPEPLRCFLDWDVAASEKVVKFVDQNYGPLCKYKGYMKGLEYSCHGAPWFIASGTFIFLLQSTYVQQLFVNIFIALLVDVVVVAVLKAITRRRRPRNNKNDMFLTVLVDKFSFPSGHATRAVMLACLLIRKYDLWLPLSVGLMAWSGAVCASRVLLQRHHLIDVAAGIAVGFLEAVVMSWIWLSPEAAASLVGYLLAGASEDV